jgi:ribosomal protein S18 acetylase RimI-like enzyme
MGELPESLVRLAREDELTEVGELVLAAYRADDLVEDDHPYVSFLLDTARRHREAELLVAVADTGALLGTVTVCSPGTPFAQLAGPGEWEFRMLAVGPSARGRGVAAALVAAVLDRARAAGARRIVLSSMDKMTTAHRLYLRLGFRRAPELDWQPGDGANLWGFVLDL